MIQKSAKSIRKKKAKRYIFAAGVVIASLLLFMGRPTVEEDAEHRLKHQLEARVFLSESLADSFRRLEFPSSAHMEWQGEAQQVQVHYTLDKKLQSEAETLLKQYKPDYGSIVMMEADTGRIIALASFEKDAEEPTNLALRATFPAASVFKVVTATAAIDHAGVSPSDTIRFNGGNYTLYRKNVLSDKITKWTRSISLKEAFARSINTAFGRLSLEHLNPEIINEYANRFMFNQKIPSDLPVEMGVAFVPQEKGYMLTEVASGYNKMNRMSPIQGAMIAGAVINEGRMVVPYIVDHLSDSTGKAIYRAETVDSGFLMTSDSSEKVRELMEQTILSGTSRKSFRDLVRNRQFRDLEMGGKTGHLTGDNPKGRVDWFVGYASDDNRRIAVAALTVNKKYWTVKSAYLGRSMFRRYFEPVMKEKVANN